MTGRELVRLTRHANGVAELIIDRPERHNAMTLPMYETLLELIDQCQSDTSVRCILFRGTGGKSFISGTDIGYFQDFDSGKQGLAYEAFVERVIDAVERIGVPTIAVIDGWAVGGGLALATACDFRICSKQSKFGAPIAKTLSNTLSARNIARLQAALGVPRVKKMLMLADYIGSNEALDCGFVYQACDSTELDNQALELAERLMSLSATTQQAVKETLRRLVVEQSLNDDDIIESVYGSAAFRQGVDAFVNKGR